jgi:hypothetical protein
MIIKSEDDYNPDEALDSFIKYPEDISMTPQNRPIIYLKKWSFLKKGTKYDPRQNIRQ